MIEGFGNIFRYNEELYVFLAATDEVIYAAKIVNPDLMFQIETQNERLASRHDAAKTDRNPLFWYVYLTTADFEKHAAHLAKTDHDSGINQNIDWIGRRLNDTDVASIKTEILKDGSPVPKGLKEIFTDIF